MKETCQNCAYFRENGMEEGVHLCILKEIIVKEKDRCKEFEED